MPLGVPCGTYVPVAANSSNTAKYITWFACVVHVTIVRVIGTNKMRVVLALGEGGAPYPHCMHLFVICTDRAVS
jgi:hypothetical protein